jgi:hypothetical protein
MRGYLIRRYLVLVVLGTLASAPVATARLLALVDTGELFTSDDLGVSWSLRGGVPVADAVGLIAGATSEELFLVSQSGEVHRSENAGMDWDAVGALPSNTVVDLLGLPGTILAPTRDGDLWASDDGGATFILVGSIGAWNVAGVTSGTDGDRRCVGERRRRRELVRCGIDSRFRRRDHSKSSRFWTRQQW